MKMKTSIALALILTMSVFSGKADARPDRSKSSLSTDEDLETVSDFAEIHGHNGGKRRTRHSRQALYGYSQPYSELYESRVLFLLEEINLKLKLINEQLSSRSTSHPTLIPYPVPFSIRNMSIPSIGNRFGDPIWGIVDSNAQTSKSQDDDDDDGSRPISLKPSKQNIPEGVRAPPVEHGSIQAEKSSTTPRPVASKVPQKKTRAPTRCEAAILNCCRFSEPERKNCFQQLQCSKTYETGKACLPEVINMVIKIFTEAYKPR